MPLDETSGSDASTSFDATVGQHLHQGPWTPEEHERFLVAMTLFPRGPWSDVAKYIGTRTTRQAMAHAQKTNLRRARHARGLRPPGRVPGPNSRRRQRSRHRVPLSPIICAPAVEIKLELLFAPPNSDPSSGFLSIFVPEQEQGRPTSAEYDTHIASSDSWLDDFMQLFDLSELCVDTAVA